MDLILVLDEALDGLEVSLDHLLDEAREIDFTLPAKEPFSFSRIAEEEAGEKRVRDQRYDEGDHKGLLDFSGTEVLVIYLDDDLSRLHIDTLLFDTFTPPSATTQSMGKESGHRG